VESIERESTDVISITLAQTEPEAAPAPSPGQFLTVRLRPGPNQPPVTRNYSLSSSPAEGRYRIGVKREPYGVASGHLHTRLAVGDLIDVAAPRGSFTLQPGEHPVVLISAGIGATPVLAMLHALAAVRSEREVWWIHGARSGAEHAFRQESAGLLERLPKARRIIAYSAPDIEDRLGRDLDVTGRLTGAALDEADVPADADFYLCGPSSFIHDIGAALASRGVTPERVRTEIFGPSDVYRPGMFGETKRQPHPPDEQPGTGPLVLFSRSNLSVRWDPSFGSLLDLAEACDVPVGFGCRTGVCHLCQSGLISGNVTYQVDPLEPPDPGNVLVCCSHPRTDLALDL
jgi:ferredoxin-NADP reductase/ferredoxin